MAASSLVARELFQVRGRKPKVDFRTLRHARGLKDS